ncbi:TadE family protein [Nocardioides limicola]|uniref:TadE family protein n=1 Tax=Nocardioides limicola TaxID=2803368 RepID=UPI0023B2FDE5|nr:TadE family protein [Nocardioides sp. DJM-14]
MRRREERGATAVELAIIFPAVMLLVMLIVQFAVAAHAHHLAEAAAHEAAGVAKRHDGTGPAGRARAEEFLAGNAATILRDRSIAVQRTPVQVQVTVTGTVMSVVPGLNLSVTKTAAAPVERYVPPRSQP